jgi:hypothetical protein
MPYLAIMMFLAIFISNFPLPHLNPRVSIAIYCHSGFSHIFPKMAFSLGRSLCVFSGALLPGLGKACPAAQAAGSQGGRTTRHQPQQSFFHQGSLDVKVFSGIFHGFSMFRIHFHGMNQSPNYDVWMEMLVKNEMNNHLTLKSAMNIMNGTVFAVSNILNIVQGLRIFSAIHD